MRGEREREREVELAGRKLSSERVDSRFLFGIYLISSHSLLIAFVGREYVYIFESCSRVLSRHEVNNLSLYRYLRYIENSVLKL